MLKPREIERLPAAMIELYSEVEMDILRHMARRMAAFDDFIPAAQWQYQKLIEMGNYHSYIVKALASLTGKTEAEVKRILERSGQKALRFDDTIYRKAGLDPPPLAASSALQAVLKAGLDNTMGLFENLTRTTANTATRQFERALDRAWLQVNSGTFSHQEATRTAIKDMARDGLACIEYPSGHIDHMDVAVRRAVLTGVNQASLKLTETQADEMGCDLVEVTAHAGARTGVGVADHSAWQGKVYSRSGTHRKYPSLVEKTGYGTGPGLGGWNCRHSFFPFFEGISEPAYTKQELAELNAPKYEYNGQKMTEYEATQKQRYIERQIRRWKRENAAMKAAGLDTSESAAKVRHWQETQRDFLDQTGLKRQYDRERVELAGIGPKQLPDVKHMADVSIGRSVGAKSRNYEIIDKDSGVVYHFIEGSRLQDVEVFAGHGVKTPLRQEVIDGLVREFGGRPGDWQHAKGFGELTEDGMESWLAEVHWFQAKEIGKVKFKVKRWLDR